MARRNFGVTVDDSRFDRFVKKGLELGQLELRVGILRAGVKYDAGHVGKKSRNADRFSALRAGDRRRSLLSAHRLKKLRDKGKSQSFRRKARRTRVDVAKVAAVVGWEKGKRPKLPTMWLKSMDRLGQYVHNKALLAMETALRGMSGRREIVQIGTRLAMAYKADVLRAGHRDTGLLLRTINWELVDTQAQTAARQLAKAKRRARKLAKARR